MAATSSGRKQPVRRFENLVAWQQARVLVQEIYALSERPQFRMDFPLRDQIRRSAISVAGNIAEGYGREGNKEFIQFLYIARGSCDEVRSHLYMALDAGHISNEALEMAKAQAERTSQLIGGLIRYLKKSRRRGRKYE